jgi:hypothetical protein
MTAQRVNLLDTHVCANANCCEKTRESCMRATRTDVLIHCTCTSWNHCATSQHNFEPAVVQYVRCGRSLTHSLTHSPALDMQRARRYGTQRLARGLTCVRLASSLSPPTGRMQRRATLAFAIRPHGRSVRIRVRVCATVAHVQSVCA